ALALARERPVDEGLRIPTLRIAGMTAVAGHSFMAAAELEGGVPVVVERRRRLEGDLVVAGLAAALVTAGGELVSVHVLMAVGAGGLRLERHRAERRARTHQGGPGAGGSALHLCVTGDTGRGPVRALQRKTELP